MKARITSQLFVALYKDEVHDGKKGEIDGRNNEK